MVFCDACKIARLDGPEYCPNCGGPLRAVAGVVEGSKTKPEEAFTPAVPVELDTSKESAKTGEGSMESGVVEVSLWDQVRKTGKLTFNGKSQTIEEWSKETGIPVKTIKNRITRRFSVERV